MSRIESALRYVALALVAALVTLAVLALAAHGEPYRPAQPVQVKTKYASAYPAAPVVVVREFVFLEVFDSIIDLRAKDVFQFTGPVVLQPGTPVGVYGDGSEARVVPASPDSAKGPPQAKDEVPKEALKLSGKLDAAGLALALKASCASCHQEGVRIRGSTTLLDKAGAIAKGVNWKEVLEDVTTDGKLPARMPPSDSGKTPLSKDAVEAVRVLAGGGTLSPPPTVKGDLKAKAPAKMEKADEYPNELLVAVVNRSCLKCHGGDKTEKGVSFKDASAVSSATWRLAYRKVVKGEMPKDGMPLSDEEAEMFLDEALSAARRSK